MAILEIREASGLADNPAGMESFLREWYKFYNEPKNRSYFKVGGWDGYLSNVSKVVLAINGMETKQDDDYYEAFFKNVLKLTQGTLTMEQIKIMYNADLNRKIA